MTTTSLTPSIATWTPVCGVDDLTAERGVAALVAGAQVAVFLLADGDVLAVGNVDPISGAAVLSRGIVGTRAGSPVVVSPMLKQAFDLRTGACLDADAAVPVYPVRVRDGVVEVATAPTVTARVAT